MAQLGHKGIGGTCQEHGNGRILCPFLFGKDALLTGQGLRNRAEEGCLQQHFHQRQHGKDRQQHGHKNEQFLVHKDQVMLAQRIAEAQGFTKPAQRNGKARCIVGSQPVVGFQQFHPPGAAIGKAAKGGIPGGICIAAAQKFCPEVAVEHLVSQKGLIVPEIAEFVVFGLEQQHIVEVDMLCIIGAFPEQLTALEHRCLGRDVCAGLIGGTGIGCRHRPAGPGAHGMAAEAQSGGIHILHGRQGCIGCDAAAGAVGDGITGAVFRVALVKEGKIGEIHQQAVAFGAAGFHKGTVFHAVLTEIDLHTLVYITSVQKARFAVAVAILIQGHDHHTPPGQLNGVGGAGFAVILITVEQQHTGSRVFRCGAVGSIELVGQITHIRFDHSGGHLHISVVRLDPMGNAHAPKGRQNQREKHRQGTFYGRFHKISSFFSFLRKVYHRKSFAATEDSVLITDLFR